MTNRKLFMTASEKASLFVDDFVRDIVLETKRTMAECNATLYANKKEMTQYAEDKKRSAVVR